MLSSVRERELDEDYSERSPKRTRVDNALAGSVTITEEDVVSNDQAATHDGVRHNLPPSHALLGVPLQDITSQFRLMETDVGISEYIGREVSKIEGIIKQRFTDFLVHEVDLDGQIVYMKSLGMPESLSEMDEPSLSTKSVSTPSEVLVMENVIQDTGITADNIAGATGSFMEQSQDESVSGNKKSKKANASEHREPWPEHFNTVLSPFLSQDAVSAVKEMFLEGPVPPRVSDSGWGGRQAKITEEATDAENASTPYPSPSDVSEIAGRCKGERGGRSGRRGRGRPRNKIEDHRMVLSNPISSKSTRTTFHQTIRELFGGKLESETSSSASTTEDGSRIVIKWSRAASGRGRSDRGVRSHGTTGDIYPPYIHFTLQKTNRDTQDALSHLSRILHVNIKDLTVAGTKDKRGVTVQRVALKRGSKTVQDIWKLANGNPARTSLEEALSKRGERGVRVADLEYRKAGLELGMLQGNSFVITLRNVKVDSMETLDQAMSTIKNKGFINYYGMQRFGTASVPTHTIGLALLQSDWHKAVNLILQVRPGENPTVRAAREAWLIDGDLNRALELMPRRVVAERCILESYKKQRGETRNAMGALSTIPHTLRLMYIHAYQSYVWNAIVSERIRTYGSDHPVVGDLVFESKVGGKVETDMIVDGDEEPTESEPRDNKASSHELLSSSVKKTRKSWVSPRVKTLVDDDLENYTIFDVIMPLPGKDVAYPGGPLGEKYREYLRVDGLDPDNFLRKQKEYTLGGSYRKILHKPKELSWSILRYTDPDVALAQADEDKLLNFEPPVVVEDGSFVALQINLTLGTAAYATMALREVTKADTSSHFQTALTQASEDQKFRGALEVETEEN